jgi:tetratricopeptide (TPR) repeat protein
VWAQPDAAAPPAEAARPASGADGNPSASTSDAATGLGLRAYEEALAAQKLAPATALSAARLREELGQAEGALLSGRLAEAISRSAAMVESARFPPFAEGPEGRGLRFVLGDALGRAGDYERSVELLGPLVQGNDLSSRRAVRALVDHALESGQPEALLAPLVSVESRLPPELQGDVSYARGRAHERAGRLEEALTALAKVGPRSRFWAQATYLSGLIEAERGRLKQAEELFCKVADPKRTPKEAPIFGGGDFFEMRDLARLGLGRVAHEAYRFDDAQYYYYLVTKDSKHLPEALYEVATSRYEAKDHEGARQYLDELVALGRPHPYEDERYILDAYVDLATCRFDDAERKLDVFLKTYVPVQNATRRLLRDPAAMRRLLESVERDGDTTGANLGVDAKVARRLIALLRLDEDQQQVARRLARLDQQLQGLERLEQDLQAARSRVSGDQRPAAAQPVGPLASGAADQVERLRAQAAEIGRLLREAEAAGKGSKDELAQLRGELETLLLRVRQAEASVGLTAPRDGAGGDSQLDRVLVADLEKLSVLRAQASKARASLEKSAEARAREVLRRLELRLARLLRRARMGRIELVLGKKRALEVEIEALSQGLLPPSMVDSLDVARYLGDHEEYWPDDGEDWADEYVGGEGLREGR